MELIRLERERHWKGHADRPMVSEVDASFCRRVWGEVFEQVEPTGDLVSVPGEALTMTILERVRSGEMGAAQGERLRMFLELERLGVADEYYSKAQLRDRRAEARRLGITVDDAVVQSIDVALGEILGRASAAL